MSIVTGDSLHVLIHSLGKAEKRHFKIFSRKHVIGRENIYVRLFDAIKSQKVYDEKKLKGQKIFHDFAPLKSRLSKAILNSLQVFHRSVRSDLRDLLSQAEILYSKSLTKQSLKLVRKAKKIAAEHELLEEWLETLRWEFNLALKKGDVPGRLKVLDEEKQVMLLLNDQKKYRDLAGHFSSLNQKLGADDIPGILVRMNHQLKSPALSDEGLPLTIAAKQNFFDCHFQYHLLKENYGEAYHYAKKKLELYSRNPKFIDLNPSYYLSLINSFLVACTGSGNHKELTKCLNDLRQKQNNLRAPVDRAVAYFFNYHVLNLFINTGRFQEAENALRNIEPGFDLHEKNLNRIQKVILSATIAQIYFGTGKFKNCVHWLNRSMSFGEEKVRTDIECFIRIFYLMAHMENQRDRSFLRSLHKSTYGFLKKNRRLFEFEKRLMDFLKSISLHEKNKAETRKHFSLLKADLSRLNKNTWETHAQNYFDFSAWIDSKIENIPFAAAARKKVRSKEPPIRDQFNVPN